MTAVNFFIETDKIHLFTDGGHFTDAGILAAIGSKVQRIPGINAALIVSGPSIAAPHMLDAIVRRAPCTIQEVIAALPDLVASIDWHGRPYSAIVLGVENDVAMGVAAEQDGQLHLLAPGNRVRAMDTDVAFDIGNVAHSGTLMMNDQRARHGFVGGFCEYTLISEHGFRSEFTHVWSDTIGILAQATRAAKIANLTVDTINIVNNAVLAVGSGSTSIYVPNVLSMPVKLFGSARSRYRNSGSAGTVTYSIALVRSYDGKVLDIITYSRSGNSGVNTTLYDYPILAAADGSSSPGVTYALSLSAVITAPGAGISDYGWDSQSIQALYRKS